MGERLARVVAAATNGQAARWIPAAGLVTVQLIFFQVPAGAWIRGVVIGMLTALLAIGLALVYRANRIVNFAQADLGFLPVSLVIGLVVFWGWPWGVGLVIGLLGAIVLGAVVEFAFVRRFRHASRLVLTVATIGITQLLAVGALLMPRLWGQRPTSQRIPAPFDATVTIGTFVLGANDLLALVAAPLAMAAVAFFLDRTRLGIAIRATAERSDRAAMLGIPVSRLATLTWVVASLLSFIALFLRAGILGVPWGTAIGATALVPAIAALAIGQLSDLPAIAVTAIALGVLEYGVSWNASSPLLVAPIIGAAVFVTLLARHVQVGRADVSETSSWRLAEEIRPVAASGVARRRWRAIRITLWVVLVGCALARAGRATRRSGHQGQRRDRLRTGVRLARGADRVGRPDLARPGRVLRDRRGDVGLRHQPVGRRPHARDCWWVRRPARSRRSQSVFRRCACRASTSPSRHSSSPSP